MGPFAIDMYLPAFATIADDLGGTVAQVQLSLTSYFAAVAFCQVIYGPLSDVVGRKPPLYFGLSLYVLAAVACSLVTSVEALVALRFVQGVGGCAAMVITRAVVRDLYTGAEAARLMATIMLVFSVAPLLAPLTGSALAAIEAWRAIFWIIAAIGLVSLALARFLLPETAPPRPAQETAGQVFVSTGRAYLFLLRQPRFLGLVFTGGLALAGFFAYLGGSSAVYIQHYELSPLGYSAAFACNAVGFIGGAQLNSPLMRRFGAARLVRNSFTGLTVLTGALCGLTLAGLDGPYVLSACLFPIFMCLGSVIPSTTVMALDDHGPIAGTASALLGTLRLGCGAVVIALVSLVPDRGALPMVVALAGCSALACLLAWLTLGREARAEAAGQVEPA